jgi:hypothetical protein
LETVNAELVDSSLVAGQTQAVELHLYRLLLLNLALQLFDGVATYQGLRMGFKEANPILVFAFGLIGVGPALLLFKAKACGLLVLLHRAAPRHVGVQVMRGLAAVYCVLSLGPWLGKFASLAAGLV